MSGHGCSPSPETPGWTTAGAAGGRRSCRRRICRGDFAGTLEDREKALALHRILHGLPEPYKEVFGLRVFGELPFGAIGQIFGKTEGWARVTYYRAKSRILRQWEAERDESEL